MPAPFSFDARPLTSPVDPKTVREFIREMRARRGRSRISPIDSSMITVAAAIVILGAVLGAEVIKGATPWALLPVGVFLFLYLAACLVVFFVFRRGRVARFRLSRFAAANAMTYEDHVRDPALPGLIFDVGQSRHSDRLVRGHSPRFVEFGNYMYTSGTGTREATHRWGYVAMKTDLPLPHIVLNALGNNGWGTKLPTSFKKYRRLPLEDDFDKHFGLYCANGYEQDALYLFTPDIMARLFGDAAQLDVEIADGWLFLYSKRKVSTLDAATWAWLFGTVSALMSKLDQWAKWRDEQHA